MKPQQILAYLFGCLVLCCAGLVYLEYVAYAGFPDGFRTDLDRAHRVLALLFIATGLGFAWHFFRLGRSAGRLDERRRLTTAGLCFALFSAAVLSFGHLFFLFLDHGSGG
jgi:hypothetical protein